MAVRHRWHIMKIWSYSIAYNELPLDIVTSVDADNQFKYDKSIMHHYLHKASPNMAKCMIMLRPKLGSSALRMTLNAFPMKNQYNIHTDPYRSACD